MKQFLNIVFICFCLSGFAQEKHFIFIQSDNSQPFYVSLNGKLYSSSASGYVIIPKLSDGDYNFSIGFAQNAYPEQTFQYSINKKDLGFNLKNFGESGWGLFNLQSLQVTMAATGNSGNVAKALSETAASKDVSEPVISFDRKIEPETTVLKPIKVKDTLENVPLAKKEEPSSSEVRTGVTTTDTVDAPTVTTDTTQPMKDEDVAKKETEAVQQTDTILLRKETSSTATTPSLNADELAKNEPVITATDEKKERPANNINVQKVSEVKSAEGLHLSYSEKSGKNTDTIQIIIPSTPTAAKPASKVNREPFFDTATATSKIATEITQVPVASGSVQSEKENFKFLDVDMSGVRKDSATVTPQKQETQYVPNNSNCKNVANDDDYTKLRKKMAMETSDEKMISEARKAYRAKCFTTAQIKGLSTLFLSDEGRYKFFDASYLSVSDAVEYPTLQSEFIDPTYLQRFKAMLQ